MERKYFKIYARIIDENETLLVSDGSIVLENGVFEGYITDDYITGILEEQKLAIQILIYNYENRRSEYIEFKSDIDFFEISETYILEEWAENEKTEFKLEIEFKEEVKEINEIKKIDNIIKNTKIFYNIS